MISMHNRRCIRHRPSKHLFKIFSVSRCNTGKHAVGRAFPAGIGIGIHVFNRRIQPFYGMRAVKDPGLVRDNISELRRNIVTDESLFRVIQQIQAFHFNSGIIPYAGFTPHGQCACHFFLFPAGAGNRKTSLHI